MRFEFLGPAAVIANGKRVEAHGQPALALARLVLERPTPLWRGELAELLWPITPPERWEGPARHVISRARTLLVDAGARPECLVSRHGRAQLTLDAEITADVEDALRATTNAEAALERGDTAAAVAEAERARDLVSRPFFPSSEAAWTRKWQDRLRSHLVRALHVGARALVARGEATRALPLAHDALEIDPFDEAATRDLMAAHEALGSRGNALAAYEQCRRLLDDELGVRPSEETEAAYLALLGGAPNAAPGRVTVRALEQGVDALPFVGRRRERAQLDSDWSTVQRGTARAVVIEGEPGIGKTRLVAEFARAAQAGHALVLWGACNADVGLPHQPLGDVIAQLLAARPALYQALGPVGPDLAPLVPGLADGAPVAEFDDYARARLFRAVAAAFEAVADEPLVLVVDDLQWAGDDAMALLRHLTPILATRACLLAVTVRESSGAVAAALAEIHRRLETTELRLAGLTVEELAEVIDATGLALRADLDVVAAEVRARTAGNPFYVSQLVGAATTSAAPFDPAVVPDAVTQLVARRLDTLDRERLAVLSLAAVAGDDFALETLEACSPLDADRLLDLVEDFCRQRFLEEQAPGHFQFAHALVRDGVLAAMSATRRQRTHRRVADALSHQRADASVLAHHYVAAGADATREATQWSLVAGHDALLRAAWTVAYDHFTTASTLASDIDDQCAARVGIGRAQRALGDAAAGRATLEDALALARSHGRGHATAEATLALVGGGGRGVAVDLSDRERTALLRDARAGIGEDDDLLVPVLGELALSLVLTEAKDERDALTEECVQHARRTGAPDALATALWTRRVALMGPGGTEARAADAREILALPADQVAPERLIAAELALVEDLLELGDRAGATDALVRARAMADRLAHPYWSWATTCWRALDAIIDGDLERAEELAFEAFGFQAPAEHPEAVAALGVNLVDIRLFQGRAGEMIELLRGAADDNPHIPAYRAVLALCCAESGATDGARDALRWFAAQDFALPPDSNWLLATAVLADAAVTLGDRDAARVLAEVLEPYADRHVVLNCFGGGGAYWGPVSLQLGRCTALLGRVRPAASLLAAAAAAADDFGAPAAAARARGTLDALTRS